MNGLPYFCCMSLPFFYQPGYSPGQKQLILDEDTSRHVVQVLRMKEGEQLNLADGRGSLLTCEVTAPHKKNCAVQVVQSEYHEPPSRKITIAVSLLKNASRFEWLLEKITEIGVQEIIPLLCARTERDKFRHDRLQAICVSAMLQSQQYYLPVLHEPADFETAIKTITAPEKFIAHCVEGMEKTNLSSLQPLAQPAAILIGPEGDFSTPEIELALQNGFRPVGLGETRLRTETAAVVAAAWLMS